MVKIKEKKLAKKDKKTKEKKNKNLKSQRVVRFLPAGARVELWYGVFVRDDATRKYEPVVFVHKHEDAKKLCLKELKKDSNPDFERVIVRPVKVLVESDLGFFQPMFDVRPLGAYEKIPKGYYKKSFPQAEWETY